jgi:hypothetical protein
MKTDYEGELGVKEGNTKYGGSVKLYKNSNGVYVWYEYDSNGTVLRTKYKDSIWNSGSYWEYKAMTAEKELEMQHAEYTKFLKEQAVKLFCVRDVGRRCQTLDIGCDCPNCKVMRALLGKEKEARV